MTDEEKIALIALMIGDSPESPFHPLFTEEEYLQFLTYAGGDVNRAVRLAAISASMMLSGISSRERTGDIEVWNELSRNYLRALAMLIDNSNATIPDRLIPWSHSIPLDGLTSIRICDDDCHTFSWESRKKCPTRQCTTAPCSCGG